MNILVACEYSGIIRDAFIEKGHNAISCDLLPTERPGPHYQGDVFDLCFSEFDLMIAHPPCTYLATCAEWAYKEPGSINKNLDPNKLYGKARKQARNDALNFVQYLWEVPIDKVCIENPVGIINSTLAFMPRPQYIQPYQFGHDASKKTGLWKRGLPDLKPTNVYPARVVYRNGIPYYRWSNQTDSGQNRVSPGPERGKDRAKTYKGIAKAMADQWG